MEEIGGISKKVLISRLDRLVSAIVRSKETRCVTCGKRLLKNKRQAGHYIPRIVQQTRWLLLNVHVQCADCNVNKGGAISEYKLWIEQNLGENVAKSLDSIYEKYKNGTIEPLPIQAMALMYNSYLDSARLLEKRPGELIPQDWDVIQF